MAVEVFLAQQRIVIEVVYALLIVLPSLWIFFRTWKLYCFSKKDTVMWFSFTFLSFAIAFTVRLAAMLYLMNKGADPLATVSDVILPFFIMEYVIALPGFLLMYSLSKRQVPSIKPWHLFVMPALIATADILMQSFMFLYMSQILLFSIGSWVAWQHWRTRPSPIRWSLSWTMTILLVVWLVNTIGQYTIDDHPWLRVVVYALTISGLWSFLVIVQRLLQR